MVYLLHSSCALLASVCACGSLESACLCRCLVPSFFFSLFVIFALMLDGGSFIVVGSVDAWLKGKHNKQVKIK